MRHFLTLLTLTGMLLAAGPARADAISEALNHARAAFGQARSQLPAELAGVDVAAYGKALAGEQFSSGYWGGRVALDLHDGDGDACARYVAFVDLPPRDGRIRLTFCPRFSREGTPELRRLTVLHEMVHVVAGPDECRAMAFAAHVEVLATGSFTPVDRYWQANGCQGSGFRLP